MKVLEENLAGYITQTLLDIKKGCYDAWKNGDVVLRLPDKVEFDIEVVTSNAYNGITRTQTTTPAADRVTTTVDSSYTETTTQTPATTQDDNSSQGGTDGTVTNTSYTEYSYTTP